MAFSGANLLLDSLPDYARMCIENYESLHPTWNSQSGIWPC
jgi:hypothetical protein